MLEIVGCWLVCVILGSIFTIALDAFESTPFGPEYTSSIPLTIKDVITGGVLIGSTFFVCFAVV